MRKTFGNRLMARRPRTAPGLGRHRPRVTFKDPVGDDNGAGKLHLSDGRRVQRGLRHHRVLVQQEGRQGGFRTSRSTHRSKIHGAETGFAVQMVSSHQTDTARRRFHDTVPGLNIKLRRPIPGTSW